MTGTWRGAIFLLLPLVAVMNAPGEAAEFNVRDFGARNDGSARASEAINAAIQAASRAGGGTVVIPAGRYVCGPVVLASNLVLRIEAGATLEFPAERLPFTRGRHQGIEAMTPVPLIGGKDLDNVTITGRGVLTTSNADWMKLMPRSPGSAAGPNWAHLLRSLEQKTPAAEEEYEKAAPELRPPFLQFMSCTNILVSGIRIVGSAMWPIHLLYSRNAVVSGVTVETYPGIHTGGIYIDSSTDVRIDGCLIDTGDDGIVLKSGKDADGLRVNRPTENVTITNCTVLRAHGAVVLGSEIAGGIRNVAVSNISCKGTRIGIRIKSRRGRGGIIEDVRFENWTMEDVGQGISVTNFYAMEGEKETAVESVSVRTPVFRDIAISHVTLRGARVAVNIDGLPEMPIDGLRIIDVVGNATAGLKASNTVGLELHDLRINATAGPAFLIRSSKDLEMDGLTTRMPLAGTPVIRLDACERVILRNSRAFEGTDTFLSVAPGELKQVRLEGDVLLPARTPAEESAAQFWHGREPSTEPD